MRGIPTEADFEDLVLGVLGGVGWQTVHGPEIDPDSRAPQRRSLHDVVLRDRLSAAIRRLNPGADDDAVADAIRTATTVGSQSPTEENWRAYQLLISGAPVESRHPDGTLHTDRLSLIDFDQPERNDFLAVNQFSIQGPARKRRPDVVLFVNGLPLVVFELKRAGSSASIRDAFNQVGTYVRDVPDLFTWNQVCVISDGVRAHAGQFTGRIEHFAPWKADDEGALVDGSQPEYDTLIRGMLTPDRLLDLTRNFVLVKRGDTGLLTRFMAKYHQYWAVTKAIERTREAVDGDGRAGVVWHTQGSGKSMEMLWYAGQILRAPFMGNPTLVVITDRNDLDDQLFDDTFAAALPGAPLPEAPVQATSRDNLRELLGARRSGGIVFSTIQKFGLSQADREAGRAFPLLSDRSNIVVMADEAHRSNYDFIDGFARHLRDGLPNASFIGFTGTPIESADRSTREVFGDYIDVYDLTQAVEDGATVKVYYEARLARVELPTDTLSEIDDAFADAVADTEEGARQRLKSKWARVEAVVGAPKRLHELASDLVTHWEARRAAFAGKGMVVTMSRRIAADLYEQIAALRPGWVSDDDRTGRVKVVITGSASDDPHLQQHVRSKDQLRALKKRAQDPNDELELVIVRDMWLTGFDSPSMTTMYVDKPMRGANLMQAIARVNRTFKDKAGGLVVDYIGIAEDLKQALAAYTHRDQQGEQAGQDVSAAAIPEMLNEYSISLDLLHPFDWRAVLASGGPKAFIDALAGAVDHLLEPTVASGAGSPSTTGVEDGERRPTLSDRFRAHAGRFVRLYALCAGTPQAEGITRHAAFIEAVRSQLGKLEGGTGAGADPNVEAETAVRQIVSEAMTGTGVIDIYAQAGLERPDISIIDDEFARSFETADNKNLRLEAVRRLLGGEIRKLSARNVAAGRAFSEMLEESIRRYQNRAIDSAQVMRSLVELAQRLTAEARRGDELGLSNDELAFYDAIRTNDSAVEEMSDETLKAIARELVAIVRRDATTDWTVKEQVRAKLRASVKRLLRKYGYPPDKAEDAVVTVIKQAEAMAA